MSAVAFSPAAVEDLSGIWDYTAALWGVDQANRYTDDIRDACAALSMSGTDISNMPWDDISCFLCAAVTGSP